MLYNKVNLKLLPRHGGYTCIYKLEAPAQYIYGDKYCSSNVKPFE